MEGWRVPVAGGDIVASQEAYASGHLEPAQEKAASHLLPPFIPSWASFPAPSDRLPRPSFSEWLPRLRPAPRPDPAGVCPARLRLLPPAQCALASQAAPALVLSTLSPSLSLTLPSSAPGRSSLSSARPAASRSPRPTSPNASSSSSAPTPSGAAPSTPIPAPTPAAVPAAARPPSLPWTAPPSAGAATLAALSGQHSVSRHHFPIARM